MKETYNGTHIHCIFNSSYLKLNICYVKYLKQGSSQEYETCSLPACDLDGYWTPWTSWSQCTVSCGGGTRDRIRECVGPYGNGQICLQANITQEIVRCSVLDCPAGKYWCYCHCSQNVFAVRNW